MLSFQGDRLGGTPQARRRGRIYLGGLSSLAISDSTGSTYPMIQASIRTRIAAAATAFRDDATTANLEWVVWSETDSVGVPVTNGWLDNAPDTQRRRSVDSTIRTLWT